MNSQGVLLFQFWSHSVSNVIIYLLIAHYLPQGGCVWFGSEQKTLLIVTLPAIMWFRKCKIANLDKLLRAHVL